MPTWSGILDELRQSAEATGSPQSSVIRRKYLVEAAAQTGRDLILYATKWTQPDPHVTPELVSIVDEDLQGLVEVIHGLNGPNLDLFSTARVDRRKQPRPSYSTCAPSSATSE